MWRGVERLDVECDGQRIEIRRGLVHWPGDEPGHDERGARRRGERRHRRDPHGRSLAGPQRIEDSPRPRRRRAVVRATSNHAGRIGDVVTELERRRARRGRTRRMLPKGENRRLRHRPRTNHTQGRSYAGRPTAVCKADDGVEAGCHFAGVNTWLLIRYLRARSNPLKRSNSCCRPPPTRAPPTSCPTSQRGVRTTSCAGSSKRRP